MLSHSQNFLKNSQLVRSLLVLTDIGKEDLVVEIGPGKGIITAELSKRARKVVAIEVDPSLVQSLRQRFSYDPKVKIVKADFRNWDLPDDSYKVFANIPFNLTADMVNKLLLGDNPPSSAFLFMQDKAALRFVGQPAGQNSQIAIFLQPFYEMEIEVKIASEEFFPQPDVKIVLASFKKRLNPLVGLSQKRFYWDFVAFGYNQWQPTITDALRDIFSSKQLKIIAKNLKLSGLKPSQLLVDQWVGLFETFLGHVPREKQKRVEGAVERLRKKQEGMVKRHRTRK
jgi:23S rRNA (adenine-N6)-dimethyltransferase